MTFSNRHTEVVTVVEVDQEHKTVTWDNGFTFGGIPEEHWATQEVGKRFVLETVQLSRVTGMAPLGGDWLWHQTDEDLEAERQKFREDMDRRHEEQLAEHRADWERREAALPEPLRLRLQRFRDNGGHFDRDGWGYELVISELAVLYQASGREDTEEINEYAREQGTSGNQHDYAKVLSRFLDEERHDEIAHKTIAGLAPLTGDAGYYQ